MTFEEIVEEIRSDFRTVSEFSNEELLAICTKIRLEELDKKYEKEFDRLLLSLHKDCIDEHDFDKLSKSINSLSNVLFSLYATLIDHIKFYS